MKQLNESQKQWLADLRSGEYKQAKNALKIGDGFCCLGVAANGVKGMEWKDRYQSGYVRPFSAQDKALSAGSTFLRSDLLEVLGISDDDQTVLAKMNDEGVSFPLIADHIQSIWKLKGYQV